MHSSAFTSTSKSNVSERMAMDFNTSTRNILKSEQTFSFSTNPPSPRSSQYIGPFTMKASFVTPSRRSSPSPSLLVKTHPTYTDFKINLPWDYARKVSDLRTIRGQVPLDPVSPFRQRGQEILKGMFWILNQFLPRPLSNKLRAWRTKFHEIQIINNY